MLNAKPEITIQNYQFKGLAINLIRECPPKTNQAKRYSSCKCFITLTLNPTLRFHTPNLGFPIQGLKNHLSWCPGQVEFQAGQAYIFTQCPADK